MERETCNQKQAFSHPMLWLVFDSTNTEKYSKEIARPHTTTHTDA